MDAQHWAAGWDDDSEEYFEERSAIFEFDAKLPRVTAEAYGRTLTEQYRTRRVRLAAGEGQSSKPRSQVGARHMTEIRKRLGAE
ncbi:MAG: hypothetical protein AB1450_13360 [Pseudomonadota bacterium]